MDEAYRMLGREHQADLEREAQKRHLAAAVRTGRTARMQASDDLARRKRVRFMPSRLAAFLH